MSDGPTTGGCLCGSVRFEITESLFDAGYCHCTRCQRCTGTAASPQARIPPGALRVTSGQELVKAYAPGDGGFEKLFCSRCGSAMFSRNPADHGVMSVRLGTIDGDPGVRPSYRQFVAFAPPWEPVPDDGLQRFPERRTGS